MQTFAAENAKRLTKGFEPALAALRAADPVPVRRVLVPKIRTQSGPAEAALKPRANVHLAAAKRPFDAATAGYRTILKVAITAVAVFWLNPPPARA